MSTLDNINENILNKIDIIDNLNEILIEKIDIFNLIELNSKRQSDNGELSDCVNNIKNNYIAKNIIRLHNNYNNYLKIKNIYEINSILFLTDYYSILNNISINNSKINKKNIYNDNIFLLDTKTENYLLDADDIINLKDIYYSNYYQYKVINTDNGIKNSNKFIIDNKKLSKTIYNKFNIFILSEDIYGIFDNYVDYIYEFIFNYQPIINELLINNKSLSGTSIEKLFKKCYIGINNYKKTKFSYNIDDINYDICNCGHKMIIQSNTSELLCIKCGAINTLIGSVFEDSQFFNQEGNRYKHGSYDPNRHCKFWIERIQAKENTIIDNVHIEKIKNCIKKDKIENIKNISIEQFRSYLKQTNLSKLNDHIPLIKKIITGYIPPQLTHNELHLLFNYFDKATKTYEHIKPNSKSNSLYYPFLIYKILEIIIENDTKKKNLLNCIHLQSYKTLIDNDKIWYQICKYNNYFVYKPTNKINLH